MKFSVENERINKPPINFRLSVYVASAIALGVASAINFAMNNVLSAIAFICPAVLFSAILLIFYTDKERLRKHLFICGLGVLFFVTGLLAAFLQISSYKNADLNNHYYTVKGKVAEKSFTDYGSVILLDNVCTEGVSGGNTKYKIALYVYGDTSADIGDEITFYSFLLDRDIRYEDRFSASYISEKIKYTASLDAEEIKTIKSTPDIFQRANLFIRDSLLSGLGDEEFGVAYALLTGNSEFMSEEILSDYRNAGVAHIFAVSGLHIGFFAIALGFILKKLRVNGWLSAVAVILCCIFYSGICNFSSSSIRATIMCAATYFAALFGERYDGLSSTGVAAAAIILFNPAELYCVGFLLSFGVVAGIILLARPLASVISFLPAKFAKMIGTVISAQIASIPISLWAFGRFSLIAVIANLLLLPFVGIIYVSLLILTVFAGITGLCNELLFIHGYILKFVNMCISAIDYDIFIIGGITFGVFAVFYYAACLVGSGIISIRKIAKTVLLISLCTVFVAGVWISNAIQSEKVSFYACGSDKFCSVLIKNPEGNVLIVADCERAFSLSGLRRIALRSGVDNLDSVIILNSADFRDVQVIATRLSLVFDFDNIFCYGEKDSAVVNVMEQSFPEIKYYPVEKDGEVCVSGGEYAYVSGGNVMECHISGISFAVFGRAGEQGFQGVSGNYDVIIATEFPERIYALYSTDKIYSFRFNSFCENAEKEGNILLKLP